MTIPLFDFPQPLCHCSPAPSTTISTCYPLPLLSHIHSVPPPKSDPFLWQLTSHSAMGQSRSTTILIAYLISIDPTLTPASQLTLVQQTRPMAKPNHSFMAQLYLYHRIGCPKDVDSAPEYQRWCWERRGKEAQTSGKPPNVAEVSLAPSLEDWKVRDGIVEDWKVRDGIAEPAASSEETARGKLYRCKRCRTPLASSAYVLPLHASQKCSHIWLQQPLSWMREELELGKLDGRFECPRKTCRTQVGRYAWQGLRCSCSQWVVPGLSLGVGKVDEVAGKGGGGGQENGGEKT